MADYKDIINGTISSIMGKAKEIAASDTVTGLVDKVKTAAEDSGVAKVYTDGANRTKAYAKITRLTLEANGEQEELNRVYTEIGKLYFDQAPEAEGFFVPLFEQAKAITQRINDYSAEIQSLKDELESAKAAHGVDADSDLDVDIADFEQIVDATESDGTAAEDKKDD